MTFEGWFDETIGRAPHGWQAQLGRETVCMDRLIQIPTGYGKTLGVAASWLYHRVARGDREWPTRLVWVLPMRALVEQTQAVLAGLIARAGVDVGLHVLMGGADSGDWHLFPERPAILIGTQDMILSRALNRGYGAGRARWPAEFGLVNLDALWVLDEVQLMDVGLSTALQLAAFRRAEAGLASRPVATWAMSATVQRDWLEKSPDTVDWAATVSSLGLAPEDRMQALWRSTTKVTERRPAGSPAELAAAILAAHQEVVAEAPFTLVVVNTVKRARELHDALAKRLGKARPDVELSLLHSRFRPKERARWRASLLAADAPARSRVVVATQVVEAGVDISADVLFTELCPWPSLVQRLGRLARRGGTGRAIVVDLDREKQAAPYTSDELEATWDALAALADGSPRGLQAFEEANSDLLPGLYPYEPKHLLLREELEELFDTSPDLSGADLDVSRFIRSGDERDVLVSWIEDPTADAAPEAEHRPARDGLCAVPFLEARDWLFGRDGRSKPKAKALPGKRVFVRDYLDDTWRDARAGDVFPGQVLLVTARSGGYAPEVGFDPSLSGKAVAPLVPGVSKVSAEERADSGEAREDLSEAVWQTIGFHGGEVGREVEAIAGALSLDAAHQRHLNLAGRWHDVGKAHPAFQACIRGLGDPPQRPTRVDLAKAPPSAWRSGRQLYVVDGERRSGFRHELASALSLFAVLQRHAPASHPARLGEEADWWPGEAPSAEAPPTAIELEILELDADTFDFVAYLVMSHHGKVRARLHATPADQEDFGRSGEMAVRGVRHGDRLPSLELATASGGRGPLPGGVLSLDPAGAGLSAATGRSWTERVLALQARVGTFQLAWFEAVFRAADVRASRAGAIDPELHEEAP